MEEGFVMITSLAWVPKGYAKAKQLDEETQKMQQEEIEEELKMEEDEDMPNITSELKDFATGQNKDDYPMVNTKLTKEFETDSDEDMEDYNFKPEDADDEFSSLEIMIYEADQNNLFVHHEITLSAFPLCVDWLSIDFNSASAPKNSNLGVVGTFLPEIEIWDLNIVNCIQPKCVLGSADTKKGSKKKKKGIITHTDAVVSLHVHEKRPNLLISGSADKSIILWDLAEEKGMAQYDLNKERVNCLQWHPLEEPYCLSSSLSGIHIFDTRQANTSISHKSQKRIEKCVWKANGNHILLATEDGYIQCLDSRKMELDYIFSFKAHSKEINALSLSSKFENLLSTFSADGFVKLWDIENEPTQVALRHGKIGKLLCGSFYKDAPLTLATGGDKGELMIWDTAENPEISSKYESQMMIE